jgi:hypothetical protein
VPACDGERNERDGNRKFLGVFGSGGQRSSLSHGALHRHKATSALEILTQVARTYSLRKRFDEAHQLLDEIEPQLASAGPRVRVRYLLERGRTFNSSGNREKARELFVAAWEVARPSGLEGLAVDAAHMGGDHAFGERGGDPVERARPCARARVE